MPTLKKSTAIALALTVAACSSPQSPSGAAATTQAAPAALSRASADGTFARYLLTPAGDADGALLDDGTLARFPPHAIIGEVASLQAGDAIHVEGTPIPSPSGRVFDQATVAKGATTIVDGTLPPPAVNAKRPRPPTPGAPPDDGLHPMSVKAAIAAFTSDPRGRLDGLVLVDGTTVRTGPRAQLEALGLTKGDTVTVTGRGASFAQGKALRAEAITLATGEVRALGPSPRSLTPASRDGVIGEVLLTPHGDVDGWLLEDGTVVRIPPLQGATGLVQGSKVHVEGTLDGKTLRAERATANGKVFDFASAPPTPPPPPDARTALAELDASGVVKTVLRSPDGDPDALLLADGTIVKLGRRLRDDIGDAVHEGMQVRAHGEGGKYPTGTAIQARALEVNGRSFNEPQPPAPAPGAPPPR